MHWNLIPSRSDREKKWILDARIRFNARVKALQPLRRFVIPGVHSPASRMEVYRMGREKSAAFRTIRHKSERPFAIAVVESGRARAMGRNLSCTVLLSMPASGTRASIGWQSRSPKIFDDWLDPARNPASKICYEAPIPMPRVDYFPISRLVNNPRNDGPECLERRQPEQLQLDIL